MSKSTLVQLHDFLETTNKQYWAATLQSSIVSLAKNFFIQTEDYIDIDDVVYGSDNSSLVSRRRFQPIQVCGNTYFMVGFTVQFDKNPDTTEGIHVVSRVEIKFHLNGSVFDVTDDLMDDFLNHIQATGLRFIIDR